MQSKGRIPQFMPDCTDTDTDTDSSSTSDVTDLSDQELFYSTTGSTDSEN